MRSLSASLILVSPYTQTRTHLSERGGGDMVPRPNEVVGMPHILSYSVHRIMHVREHCRSVCEKEREGGCTELLQMPAAHSHSSATRRTWPSPFLTKCFDSSFIVAASACAAALYCCCSNLYAACTAAVALTSKLTAAATVETSMCAVCCAALYST